MDLIELPRLNFPENYQFRFKQQEERLFIFCFVRKKWLIWTPEEWVRQHVLHYLVQTKKYSKSSIASESFVKLNGMKKRADIVVYKKEKPFIIIECKAPSISISQTTFDQIARYNLQLGADYLMVTNGLDHYYCQMDMENERYVFLEDLPDK